MNTHIKNAESYFREAARITINEPDQILIHKLAFGLSDLTMGLHDLDERLEVVEQQTSPKKESGINSKRESQKGIFQKSLFSLFSFVVNI